MPDEMPLPASIPGLSEADAQARLQTEGYNELPRPDRRTPLRIVLEVLREPMLALLLGGGAIYLAARRPQGSHHPAGLRNPVGRDHGGPGNAAPSACWRRCATSPVRARWSFATACASASPAAKSCAAISWCSPKATGCRPTRVIIECRDLQTDESLLTGESVPVRKIARAGAGPSERRRPGGDDLPYVFSGSLVVRGTAMAEVIATGVRSEIGKIGQSLATLETEPPRLQAQTRRLVRIFAIVGAAVSVLAVVLYGTLRGGWLDAVLAGIALGMSMLPEEFPVVLTVFMAMGAWRISQARVLTRRAAAIETLGSATVLCTDKTGTLTENRMTIAELRLADGETFRPGETPGATMPERFHALVECGILASARDPFDPMEKAFHDLGGERLAGTGHLHGAEWKLVHAYGLRPGSAGDVAGLAAVRRQSGVRRRGQGRAGSHRRAVPSRRRRARRAEARGGRHGGRRPARARRRPRLLRGRRMAGLAA